MSILATTDHLTSTNLAGRDPTGEVDLQDIGVVRSAIHALLECNYGKQYKSGLIDSGIDDVVSAFGGKYTSLLRCDTLYHDLRHALETGLTAARLIDAHALLPPESRIAEITSDQAVIVVILAIFHDIGLLRRTNEAHLWGPELTPVHEERGVEFMEKYWEERNAAGWVGHAKLIMATKLIFKLPHSWSQEDRYLASILATADLLSQLADRCYLEKCRDFLFLEFSAFGLAGKDGTPYPDRETLLEKTPGFFNGVIRDRLDDEFQGVHRLLDLKYGSPNPWESSIQRNLKYLEVILNDQNYGRLRRHPKPFLGC
jgi:hypothetical protein